MRYFICTTIFKACAHFGGVALVVFIFTYFHLPYECLVSDIRLNTKCFFCVVVGELTDRTHTQKECLLLNKYIYISFIKNSFSYFCKLLNILLSFIY